MNSKIKKNHYDSVKDIWFVAYMGDLKVSDDGYIKPTILDMERFGVTLTQKFDKINEDLMKEITKELKSVLKKFNFKIDHTRKYGFD
jgi:hypothetical protein